MDDDYLFVERVDHYRSICVSPLDVDSMASGDIEGLGGDCGYFIYEIDDNPLAKGVSVLAKAASFEAALRLIDLWRSRMPLTPN